MDRQFERFINQVHRRHTAIWLVERMGLGLLGGCAVALPLLIIAIWWEADTWSISGASLLLGSAVGLFWGAFTRPARLDSAMEADRQLHSADLLSSAMIIKKISQDEWMAAVLAEADRFSRVHSPSSVLLNRMGARAWGGVGLATALMFVLAMLPTYATTTIASENATSLIHSQQSQSVSDRSQPSNSNHHRTSRQNEPEDAQANRMTEAADDTANQQSDHPSASSDRSVKGGSEQSGSGQGESHSNRNENQQLANPTQSTNSTAQSADGRAATGTGRAMANPKARGKDGTGPAGLSQPLSSTPPWQSSHWPVDVERARRAVDSGQVPDSYRDVVREYFKRD